MEYPRRREDLESNEDAWLAPWGMRSRESRGRRHSESPDPRRTCFQRDRDRIVHCSAFRRLDNKTQVFVSRTGDHYRTRLTHSLEVAQISRSIARSLGLNEDLCEAVALAHDLGHAPFGHSGGDVLARLMKEHGGFEHNLQSLRIVDHLEERYPGIRGLNLTWEVRECIIKHNRPYEGRAFLDYEPRWGPLLEAQLVDLSDGIAYMSHDLDDGLTSGILDLGAVDDLAVMKEVGRRVETRWPGIRGDMRRKKCVSEVINYLLMDLVETSVAAIDSLDIRGLEDVRRQQEAVLGFSEEVREQERELRGFLYENFYTHERVQRMRSRARIVIEGLFQAFTHRPGLLPPRYRSRIDEEGMHRVVADYISGMTDGFAEDVFARYS